MSKEEQNPGPPVSGPDDVMSATGMFQGSFRREPDPFEAPSIARDQEVPVPPRQAPPRPAPAVQGGGEFTQLFGSKLPATKPNVPQVAPFEPASEATRMFSAPAAVPKVKGYSSPGGSDSASGEGGFTQLFRSASGEVSAPRSAPPVQFESKSAPPIERRDWSVNFATPDTNRNQVSEAPGVTDLFRALSTNDRERPAPLVDEPVSFSPVRPLAAPSAAATIPADSFTAILQKLTESTPLPRSIDTPQTGLPAVAVPAAGQGEFTRIIAAEETKARGSVPAAQEAAETKVFPVKPEMPKPAALKIPTLPPVAIASPVPPKSKLQAMVPFLLLLNAFLMFVLIMLAIFMLLRK